MKLLLLGGISEAVKTAQNLHDAGIPLVYSIAGLVRQPNLACPVISGGFSRRDGLQSWLEQEQISQVLDMTHPFATQMSQHAADACERLGLPCWRYSRPAWQAQTNDRWTDFDNWQALIPLLAPHRSVLLTAGQLEPDFVKNLHRQGQQSAQKQWLRSIIRPTFELPPSMQWIEAIGPFTLEDERALMQQHQIDALVAKNSGGSQVSAKLEIAREIGIPVYLLSRPALPPVDREFSDALACQHAVINELLENQKP